MYKNYLVGLPNPDLSKLYLQKINLVLEENGRDSNLKTSYFSTCAIIRTK